VSDDVIAKVLGNHFTFIPRDEWYVCSGCGERLETSPKNVASEFVEHQAAQVRAALAQETSVVCGGCEGLGSHRRWCRAVVGTMAASVGPYGDTLGSLGDLIGANNPGLANQAYALAAEVRAWAEFRIGPHADVEEGA